MDFSYVDQNLAAIRARIDEAAELWRTRIEIARASAIEMFTVMPSLRFPVRFRIQYAGSAMKSTERSMESPDLQLTPPAKDGLWMRILWKNTV